MRVTRLGDKWTFGQIILLHRRRLVIELVWAFRFGVQTVNGNRFFGEKEVGYETEA